MVPHPPGVGDGDAGTLADLRSDRARPPSCSASSGSRWMGRIATPTGHSRTISGAGGITHLHRLRALADAVVVGIGTVIADDPRLTVRAVAGRNPARVVIDPHGRLRSCARLLAEDGAACIVVQTTDQPRPERVTALTLPAVDGQVEPMSW